MSIFRIFWENLETRYSNSKVLIYEYLKEIVELPPVTSDWLNNLKTMRNVVITATSALKSLKRPIDEGNDLLVFMLINKLDKISRDQWELSISEETDPRIRALEATVDIKKRPESKNSNHSQSVLKKVHTHQNSTKFVCPMCNGKHNLYACSVFKEKTIDECFKYLKANSRCFNCLGKHNRNFCQSRKFCNICKKPHHSLLHRDNKNLSQSRELKTDHSVSESNKVSDDVAISSHLNSSKKYRTAVLLATARVMAAAFMSALFLTKGQQLRFCPNQLLNYYVFHAKIRMLQCPVWEEVVRIKSFIPFLSLLKRLNLVQPRSKLKHSYFQKSLHMFQRHLPF